MIDDEASIREMLRRMLEAEGFHVEEAADGESALRHIQTRTEPFDLVLTDLSMPQIDGRQISETLARYRPSVALLCMSADPDAVPYVESSDAPVRVMLKPFTAGPGIPRDWTPVLDVHPTALRPDCLIGHAWLQFPDRVREIHRQWLEFWYDPPGCAFSDEELALLRRIAEADEPVMFRAESEPFRHTMPSIIVWMCCEICGGQGGLCSRCGRPKRRPRSCAPAIQRGSGSVHGRRS